MNEAARRVFRDMPAEPDLLQAIGMVSIAHGQLDRILQFTVRTLANLPVEDVLRETSFDTSAMLRKRVLKLGTQVLGEGEELARLRDLMDRCKGATGRRNRLIHGVFGIEDAGEPLLHVRGEGWVQQPAAAELHALRDEIAELFDELRRARFRDGFIAVALLNRGVDVG